MKMKIRLKVPVKFVCFGEIALVEIQKIRLNAKDRKGLGKKILAEIKSLGFPVRKILFLRFSDFGISDYFETYIKI